jgi:hypothetical protein
VPDANDQDLPRVLLLGDSITRGYFPGVERLLKGKASVGRLATSKSVGDPGLLAEVVLVLGKYHFGVIHFNNGMHGWGYTEQEDARHFPDLIDTLKKGAKGAKLICATTTPVREADNLEQLSPRTERVKERNRIAGGTARENIPVNDLFALTPLTLVVLSALLRALNKRLAALEIKVVGLHRKFDAAVMADLLVLRSGRLSRLPHVGHVNGEPCHGVVDPPDLARPGADPDAHPAQRNPACFPSAGPFPVRSGPRFRISR